MRRVLTLSLFLLAAPSNAPEPIDAAPGQGFEVERYDVALRPDLTSTAVSGTETIVVRSTSDRLERLAFTPNALRISAATLDGEPIDAASSKDAITFSMPRTLVKGQTASLRFRIDGTPARGIKATAGGIYTSYFACDWMVCLQDGPGDKAHFALDLFLPIGTESIGIGRMLPARGSSGGLVLHRWRSTRPYSPYLYAFAAGPFLPWRVRTAQGELTYLNGTGSAVDLAGLFMQAPAVVSFLSDRAGMALPDRQYAQLLVPGREAQEAAGFSLIGKTELDGERDAPSSAWIIVHEMAHQWWGNLVTCATWQDFWLNEGLATFMVAAWKEHNAGSAAYTQELDVARRRVERVREQGLDRPLAWAGKYPSISARRAIQYSKGALFIAHLRQTIGDAAFWRGLRRYTRRHAGRTVTSKDFQRAMEQASRRDLSPMFAEWVYGK